VYSLNVAVPGRVGRLVSDLARELPRADQRERNTQYLLAKRLGEGDAGAFYATEARVREILAGQPTFAVRVTDIARFDDPTRGSAPVVYLAVESPGLEALHDRLCAELGAIEGLEGDAYTPHVTVARGGSERAAAELCERAIDPLEWTVETLRFYDAHREQVAGELSLPA
jgi:2'-5' RNA ligase